MKSDEIYVKHILEALEKIDVYLSGFSYDQFTADARTVDAVVRELMIVGEAATKLSVDFRKLHPELPYQEMQDMRNFVIHEYFDVDTKIVWDTCKKDLKNLNGLIKPLA
jgi:uncharacterized protein with HEPN domain